MLQGFGMCSCDREVKGGCIAHCRRVKDEDSEYAHALKGPRRVQCTLMKVERVELQVFKVYSCAQRGHTFSS